MQVIDTRNLTFVDGQRFKRFTFENGLKLLFLRTSIAPVFSYQTWFNVGSRNEAPGYTGIAHFLEHLMFKGTYKHKNGEFDQLMESNGARDLNAFTSMDYTAYVQSLPVESFELVAGLESDRMHNLSFSDEQFQSEREVIHNERKQRIDNSPEGQMYYELCGLAFKKHPYGHPIIGYEADLNAICRQDCLDFYRTYYSPNNSTIVIVGDLDIDYVVKTVAKQYGAFESVKLPPLNISVEPEQESERYKELSLQLQVEKAMIAYHICDVLDDDILTLHILAAILTSGRSSRLYKSLVRKMLTLDVNAWSAQNVDDSLFFFTFSCHQDVNASAVIKVIDREIEKLKKNQVESSELKRIKTKLKSEFYMGLESNSAKANLIGRSEILYQNFDLIHEFWSQMQKVTAKQVQLVAQKYFDQSNRSIVIGKPA